MSVPHEKAVVGCLLGTAVGDALGLCAENLSPRRLRRLFPRMDRYHFFFGRGMASDDTEHACMVAQALLASGGQPKRFTRSLAWRFRWWLLGAPAGIGRATLRATLKLWLGFPPHKSGTRQLTQPVRQATARPCAAPCWGSVTAMIRGRCANWCGSRPG